MAVNLYIRQWRLDSINGMTSSTKITSVWDVAPNVWITQTIPGDLRKLLTNLKRATLIVAPKIELLLLWWYKETLFFPL